MPFAFAVDYDYNQQHESIVAHWTKDDMCRVFTESNTEIIHWTTAGGSNTCPISAYGWSLSPNSQYYAYFITNVKIYGDDLPFSGTVSRTYTFDGSDWTAGAVTWTDVTTCSVSADKAVSVPISLNPSQVTVNTHTDWVKWGDKDKVTDGAFYAIPSADFTPTIEVTYNVVTNDDGNGDGSTITRKDVKSTIILNATNFQNLAIGTTTGEIHPIRIKIVPDYLYVLSDDDHATGVLVVGK